MKRVQQAVAAAAFFGLAGASGAANAATQVFNIDVACQDCGVGPSFGTVTVSEIAGDDLSVLVQLASGISLHRNQNINQHAITWNLAGSPTVTISALSDARLIANGPLAPGSETAPPMGTFTYAIDFEAGVSGPPSSPLSTFSFEIGGATALSLASFVPNVVSCSTCVPAGPHNIFFALDISNANGQQVLTGNVGATIASGVPEPSTWAMMLIGFAGLAMATRRRQRAITL
jgi:hypothetical protein